jgi:L-iditol 2-dehydrogenase
MRTVRLLGNRGVKVIEMPEPEPKDDQVVVKIMSSGICGTERHTYDGEDGRDETRGYNSGHEATGVVCKVDKSSRLREGDRVGVHASKFCGKCRYCLSGDWVMCDQFGGGQHRAGYFPGTHSQYVLIDDRSCLPMSDDIPYETGVLFGDTLGVTFHAINRLKVTGFETVLITGLGPIGLSATMLCKFLNAFVIVLDVDQYRLTHAELCGADVRVNPDAESDVLARLQEIAGPRGIDVALDCSGNPVAQTLCLDALRKGGRMAFVGVTQEGPAINTSKHLIGKELELIGSWYSRPREYPELEALYRRGLPADDLITHRFGIEEAQTAFDTLFGGGSAAKVIIDPWR